MIILRNLILVPQIIHNVRMGNNPGFNPFYVFGFIGSRLLIPMYERLCPANRFNLTPSITLVVILLGLYVLEVPFGLSRCCCCTCSIGWVPGFSSPNASSPTISTTNRNYI